MKISEIPDTGWHPTEKEYRRGWSNSAVKVFAECPARAHRIFVLGERDEPSDQTDAIRIGDAVHWALLRPAEGMRQVKRDVKTRKSPGQRSAEAWGHALPADDVEAVPFACRDIRTPAEEARFKGAIEAVPFACRDIRTPAEEARVKGAIEAVLSGATDSAKVALAWLVSPLGRSEWAVRCEDPETGVPIQARADRIIAARSGLILPDLKVTNDPRLTRRGFLGKIRDFDYVGQFAFYRRVIRGFFGDPDLEIACRWIVVGSKPGRGGRHQVFILECPSEEVDAADVRIGQRLTELGACLRGEVPWDIGTDIGENFNNGAPEIYRA